MGDRAPQGRAALETHVMADAMGRPICMFLFAGQSSDHIGARVLLSSTPRTAALFADRGYDADGFRNALIDIGISPYIPSRAGRTCPRPRHRPVVPAPSKQDHVRWFVGLAPGNLPDIESRYNRCPILFCLACALATTVICW